MPSQVYDSPATDSKDIEMDKISDKEFKRMVINEFQKNKEEQLNELRRSVQKRNEKFSKEIKLLKNNQTNLENEKQNK